MSEKIKAILLIFLVSLIALGLAWLCGYSYGKTLPREPIKTKVDTLFIYDTIKQIEPISVERRIVERVPYEVRDTMRVHDTLVMWLEREQIRWEDSLSVVYASGINPQVDSVIHYTSQMVINKEVVIQKVKKTHWGVGIQVGGGASLANGRVVASPYVGIGLNYNIISW